MRSARVALAFLNVMLLATVPCWPFVAGLGLMMFDAPGNSESWLMRALYFFFFFYPLPVVVGTLGFWVAAGRERSLRTLLVWDCISLLFPLLALLDMALINRLCSGSQACW